MKAPPNAAITSSNTSTNAVLGRCRSKNPRSAILLFLPHHDALGRRAALCIIPIRIEPLPVRGSEPCSQADKELQPATILATKLPETARVADRSIVSNPDVRSEIRHESIAEAKPQLGSRDTGSDLFARDVLEREIELGAGLKDQLLRDSRVMFDIEARRDITLVREADGSLRLDPVRREPLNAHGQPAGRPGR